MPAHVRTNAIDTHLPIYRTSLTFRRFIQANTSRRPLNCSLEDFCLIFVFHQISPSFLDFVHSFGSTDDPLDYSMTGFRWEDSIGAADDQLLKIPELGRSGRELRVSYLLRSVERSEKGTRANSSDWSIRQMAVYHTFDLETGRAFWLNIKGTSLMKDTVEEASEEFPELRPAARVNLAGVFKATLATHILCLEWCDANWRQYINDTEDSLKKIIDKAITADIDIDDQGERAAPLEHALTFRRHGSLAVGDDHGLPKTPSRMARLRSRLVVMAVALRISGSRAGTQPVQSVGNSAPPRVNRTSENEPRKTGSKALEVFTFAELQTLHHIGGRLQEMRLVVQLNTKALRDIKESYEGLFARDDLKMKEAVMEDCKRHVVEFARKVDRITRNLEVRLTQLDTMIAWLNDGKALVSFLHHRDDVSLQETNNCELSSTASSNTGASRPAKSSRASPSSRESRWRRLPTRRRTRPGRCMSSPL